MFHLNQLLNLDIDVFFVKFEKFGQFDSVVLLSKKSKGCIWYGSTKQEKKFIGDSFTLLQISK